MNQVDFRSQEFGEGSANVVALVAGFDGKIEHLNQAALDLVAADNDVIAYEYDNDVFLAGDGTILPSLIKELSKNFSERTSGHISHRFAGASLGGGIGWNMQKNYQDARPGAYAAIGANVAHLVMANPIFRGVVKYFHKIDTKKEFELNGYTEADLYNAWKELHVPPTTGFAVALGGLDYVIRRSEVMPKFKEWQKEADIRIITKRRLGHTGVIKWFNENIKQMLYLAQ